MGGKDSVGYLLFSGIAALFWAASGLGFWEQNLESLRAWGFLVLGVGVFLIPFVWQKAKRKIDENSSRYRRWNRRMSSLVHALPIIGIVVGGFLFVASVAWMLAQGRQADEGVARTLTRYVLPRHLTDAQIKTISTYLSGFPPQTAQFLVIQNNEEASSYRADLQRALMDGGWTISAVNYSNDVREGLTWQLTQPQAAAQQSGSAKNPTVDWLFSKAMEKAHVQIAGSGGGSGRDITTTTFVIAIGHRRMDDGDLTMRKRAQEEARRLLDDPDSEE